VHDVELVKSVVSDKMRIKVAGGITTYEQAIAFIRAGVQRIGTSYGPQIIDESDIQVTGDKKE
jgi:deoxyribose-phosphate aldolase